MSTIAITGANGNLGRRLIGALSSEGSVRAIVRSERAAQTVRSQHPGVDVCVLDYGDSAALARALDGCEGVVHLVGIIKETRGNTYRQAHEDSCAALATAASDAGIGCIVYLSIVGSRPGSKNPCLASKGRAEQILAEGRVAAFTLRVPMVLGEGDYASFALARRARSRFALSYRAASLEQPVYAGDVVAAIGLLLREPRAGALDLGGPESLSRAELTRRAAAHLGRQPRIVSLPLGLGMAIAWVMEKLMPTPPVTRAMLGVLDHDDTISPAA